MATVITSCCRKRTAEFIARRARIPLSFLGVVVSHHEKCCFVTTTTSATTSATTACSKRGIRSIAGGRFLSAQPSAADIDVNNDPPAASDTAEGGEDNHNNSNNNQRQRTRTTTSTTTAMKSRRRNNNGSRKQQQQRLRRPIFVAATRQHVGKTSTCTALMSGLQKRFEKVGFMKPVGQQSLDKVEANGEVVRVDRDASLIKEHFGLDHVSYQHASPVMIPAGYTRDYLDGKISVSDQRNKILSSLQHISDTSDAIVCEGTGHCAVGSIVDVSNAQAAAWLQARMVLVANGGLGGTMDELELNRSLCEQAGVDIAGVIINKVKPEKYEQTKHYLTKALKQKWDIPLLGCIPDKSFLGCPTLADLERLLGGSSLVSGKQHALRHYHVEDATLVTTSLEVFLRNMRHKRQTDKTLYVCHSSRNDIMLGFLMESQRRSKEDSWHAAMVVTGCEEHPISTQVLEIVTGMPAASAPAVLLAHQPSAKVMQEIYNYTPKMNVKNGIRVTAAAEHYESYIDFDLLLDSVGYAEDDEIREEATK